MYFLLVVLYLHLTCGFNQYNNSVVLYRDEVTQEPIYTVYWKVNGEVINIAFEVKTSGWMGFGLGEPTSGSMPGADFFTAEWNDNNELLPDFDRYADKKALPLVDMCQDWKVLSYSRGSDTVPLRIEIERKLVTSDTQDRPIKPGSTRVLWAYGPQARLTYHTSRRGATFIEFIHNPLAPPDIIDKDVYVHTFSMPNISLPTDVTTYMCLTFRAPQPEPGIDYHIVKLETIVDPRNVDIVHHLLFHNCIYDPDDPNNNVGKYFEPAKCFSPLGNGGCYGLSFGWAVGGNPLILPEEAGFRMGEISDTAVQWFILEIHYDNAKQEPGHVDQTGVKIYYTKNLRKNDAGTIMLGNVDIREHPIPPGLSAHLVETTCPSDCTFRWSHSINVFADFQHMHYMGKMIWSTVHRSNNRLPGYLNRIEYWDFNFQDNIPNNWTIRPGDRINTNCLYDTTSKTTPTRFGHESTDEMCLEFISYYPLLKVNGIQFSECGSARGLYRILPDGSYELVDPNRFRTSCGGDTVWGPDGVTAINPDVRDPPGGEIRTFPTKPPFCPATNIIDGKWTIALVLLGFVTLSSVIFFVSL